MRRSGEGYMAGDHYMRVNEFGWAVEVDPEEEERAELQYMIETGEIEQCGVCGVLEEPEDDARRAGAVPHTCRACREQGYSA